MMCEGRTEQMLDDIIASIITSSRSEFGRRSLHLLKQHMVVLVCLARSEQLLQIRQESAKLADTLNRIDAERRRIAWCKLMSSESSEVEDTVQRYQ